MKCNMPGKTMKKGGKVKKPMTYKKGGKVCK
jgi:hypothetical protein